MGKRDNDFQKRLLATFAIEAAEHVQAISSGLINLEKAASADGQLEMIETIFREAHSLKGAARSVNLTDIERVCQALESVFSALKRREIVISPALLDRLHQTVDVLNRLLKPETGEPKAGERPTLSSTLRDLEALLKPQGISSSDAILPASPETSSLPTTPATAVADRLAMEERSGSLDTIRIDTARLDSLLLQTEELLSAKLAADQRAVELQEIGIRLGVWRKQWAKAHPAVRALARSFETTSDGAGVGEQNMDWKTKSHMAEMLGYMEWNKDIVESLDRQLAALTRAAQRDRYTLGRMVDNLLQDMKQASMLPFSSVLEVFPKLLRDLSRERGNEVGLVVRGAEIEVDRRILQAVKDPLIHLIRNCVDHGIERPEARERKSKPPKGTIVIAIEQKEGGKVEVLVSDDGAGIDAARVRSASIKLGLVAADESLSEVDALALIFQSGISTKPIITDISGRGLGLAIVQEKVEKLGGTVSVETRPDVGTTFRILLPVTLATFRGVLVSVDDHLFVLPAANVEQVTWVKAEDIQTVENRETIRLNGTPLSLVRLGIVLELSGRNQAQEQPRRVPVVVLSRLEKRLAFQVDKVLGEQEVLVKGLGPQLARVRNVAGVTVLGTGQVVPTLNVADLMKSAVRTAGAPARPATVAQTVIAKRKSILVAEDSITARTLLKSILEGAGYEVQTAVDGVEALTVLKTQDFDLLVSDIDMPRMSGLDLTGKIRADKKLADLPVILVTALESRQDRERGIDVGANAYLIKSSFDQSNLLDAIARLI